MPLPYTLLLPTDQPYSPRRCSQTLHQLKTISHVQNSFSSSIFKLTFNALLDHRLRRLAVDISLCAVGGVYLRSHYEGALHPPVASGTRVLTASEATARTRLFA